MKKRGYTLIEVIVAFTIFVSVMVIAVVTFAWAANYNSKLKQVREVNQTAKMIIEQLSSEVRMANGEVKYFQDIDKNTKEIKPVGEMTFFDCTSGGDFSQCRTTYNSVSNSFCRSSDDDYLNNPPEATEASDVFNRGLLILMKNRNRAVLYTFLKESGAGDNYNVYRGEIEYNKFDNTTSADPFDIALFSGKMNKMNEDGISVEAKIGGCGPKKYDSKWQNPIQPFLKIILTAKSSNFENLPPAVRAEAEYQTSIASRDYN